MAGFTGSKSHGIWPASEAGTQVPQPKCKLAQYRKQRGISAVKLRVWPRSIRLQLLFGLVLLEALSLLLFAAVLIRQQAHEVFDRARQRLEHQANSLAVQTREALEAGRPETIRISARMMGDSPSVEIARITDPRGRDLFVSQGRPGDRPLAPAEFSQIQNISEGGAYFFTLGA